MGETQSGACLGRDLHAPGGSWLSPGRLSVSALRFLNVGGLQLLDGILTWYGVAAGLTTEINPLLSAVAATPLILVVKLLGGLAIAWYCCRRPDIYRVAVWISALVVVFNLVSLVIMGILG